MIPKRKRRKAGDSDYISNAEFLLRVIESQHSGICSERLGELFIILATRYSSKPNFSGYSYKDEMISHALVACVASVDKFNAEKYDNPFAYFTQVIHSAFLQILKKEKNHQKIRDKALLEDGQNPSMNYSNEQTLYNEDEIDEDNVGFEMLEQDEPSEIVEKPIPED